MLCLVLLVALSVLASTYAALAEGKMGSAGSTGAILSAQFYCDMPCKEKTGLYLSAVNPNNAQQPLRLQQFLPPAPVETRDFPLHTVYEPASKIFMTFGVDYPLSGKMTAWTSVVSGTDQDTMKASSIGDAIELTYPVSSAPSPLNYVPLTVARVVLGPQNIPHVIFTNGEVHAVDLTTGVFTLKHRLISDSQALDVSNPSATTAQVFDSVEQKLYSVLTAGMYAYLVITDFSAATPVSTQWLQMDANMCLDPGSDAVQTDYSTQTFTNALIVRNIPHDKDPVSQQTPRLMVVMESLNDVGFDQLVFVNTTTGVADVGPIYNLMPSDLVFKCQPNNCDYNRVSTYDAASGTVYFQAHMAGADENNAGNIALGAIGLSMNEVTQNLNWYVQVMSDEAPFGFNAFQYYNF